MRTDNKWIAAKPATCQLVSDTTLIDVHDINTYYCCTCTTTSHTKSENIYCCKTRSILNSNKGDYLAVEYLLGEA